MLKKLFGTENENSYSMRANVISRILSLGLILALLSMLEEIAVTSNYITLIPLIVISIGIVFCMVIIYKFHKSEAAAVIIGFIVVIVAFPSVFFMSGGINGGSTVWFVLGIFYFIGMFKGIKMIILTGISIIADATVYYIGYRYPQYITQLVSIEKVYIDSFFAVVFVGVLLGTVTKYQLYSYARERELALSQRDEIELLSDTKSDFFASMSHEIRTPINTIIGLNEMILRENNISEETMENAVTIQNASKMLLSLVNDILDLSQIESKKMEIIPLDYKTTDFFSDLIDMIKINLEEKNLEFIVHIDKDFPSVLNGDDKRLKQVVINILSNAAKYTKQGSVTLNAHAERIGEEWCNVSISVSDTGIGIRSENLDVLFESFKRIDATDNRKIEGTGLGLSISKQLIELMGGKITVDSIYTKGSVFTIMLEQKIVDPQPIGNINFLSGNKQREIYKQKFEAPEARVLIVDDNELNRSVISKLLSATKLQIDLADSGQACLELTQKRYYNIILMDYLMPEMNGDEVALLIKKQESGLCRDTPIIALTADYTLGRNANLSDNIFDGFVEKPIKSNELEETILNLLPEDVIEYQLKTYDKESSTRMEIRPSHKRKKIIVTTECLSDLPFEIRDKYGIKMIYSYILVGESRFYDTLEVDSDNLGQIRRDGEDAASTQAASVEDYEKFFAECLTEAEDVIHISLGMNIGDSYKNAVIAAKGFGHVHVVDSGHISGGMAILALSAAKMANRGESVNTILETVNMHKNNIVNNIFLPSCEYLYKKGFTSFVFAKLSELLHFHPVVKTRQSSIKRYGLKVGRVASARKRFVHNNAWLRRNSHNDICFISHAGLSVREQEELYNEVKSAGSFETIFIEKCSVTNACHTGLGAVCISFFIEKKLQI